MEVEGNCDQAFGDIKRALTSETTLMHYDPDLLVELSLCTCIQMGHAVLLPMHREH